MATKITRLIMGNEKACDEALETMRERGGTWAAYQNHDLGHRLIGSLRFLKVGEECTYRHAPARLPDTQSHIGWRYLHVGYVDLATGEIKEDVQ